MIYIGMDDLVGNAFVSYLERTGKRELSIKKIECFGNNCSVTIDVKQKIQKKSDSSSIIELSK